nr:reverse transcriptase domain-containing protein [Tanacetum cinerariifolium]
MPPKRTSTSAAPIMTQAAIKQLVADSITTALKAQAANMANVDDTNRNPEPREAYNSFAQPIGIEEAYKLSWVEFKKLLIKKYCPKTKIQKMEDKFYHLTVKGNDLKTHVRRFQELATLCPTMVSDSEKMMEAFIGGLPRSQLGKGKGTWGGRVEAFWNSSHELQVHRKGKWGGLVLAGKVVKLLLELVKSIRFWQDYALVPDPLASGIC